MSDDLITKALKNAKESLIPASEVIAILKDLQDQIRIFNKRYIGSIGGAEEKRLQDVKFQTYPKHYEWPIQISIFSPSGGPGSVVIPRLGKMRIRGASYCASIGHSAGISMMLLTWNEPAVGPRTILSLTVSGASPCATILLPEPYPSTMIYNNEYKLYENSDVTVTFAGAPADTTIATIYYEDRIQP